MVTALRARSGAQRERIGKRSMLAVRKKVTRTRRVTVAVLRRMSSSGCSEIPGACKDQRRHCLCVFKGSQAIGSHLSFRHSVPGGRAGRGRDWDPTQSLAF
jgi:hypothetical protein